MLRLSAPRRRRPRPDLQEERGAVAVIVALTMVVVLAMAALVIDVGATQARKAQLQEAVDASALAIAQGCAGSSVTTLASCASSVRTSAAVTADALAHANLDDAIVAAPVFTASTVTVSATSTQVGTFSQVLGIDSTGVAATATAQWQQKPTLLPLTYHECALPAPSTTSKVFLRYDLLDLSLSGCGLIGGVTDLLGPGWLATGSCSYDLDLATYVTSTLSKVLPASCSSLLPSLIGKQVLLPVYDRVLVPIVVDGVLLGNGYQVEKYALFTVTGYDFQTLNVNVLGAITATLGPKDITGAPQCPSVSIVGITLELPTCQGLQGYFTEYLTPDEAAQRLAGVKLIE